MTETLKGCLRKGYPHYAPTPQHRPHHRPPKDQIQNNFYFDHLTVWTLWKASGGPSYVLGSPSPAPCYPHNIRHITEHLGAKFPTTFISIVFPSERPGRLQGAYLINLGAPPLPPVAPTTSATSQNTLGSNSKKLLFRSSYRLNALEGFRGPSLWTWEPLPCPLWPPQYPPHRRTPRGQIPNNFYFDLLFLWALWKATKRISYFLGDPLPHLPPSGGQGRGSRGKWPERRINRNAKRNIFCFEDFSLSLVVLAVALAEWERWHTQTDRHTDRQTEAQLWILLRDTRPSDSVIGNRRRKCKALDLDLRLS